MIEKKFDIPFIANLALREKQIQQIYRPIIAVHKWFARRPGTLFRGLLLAEFADQSVCDAFYKPNKFPHVRIADPFMGGGTPLLEANRVGCEVIGYDINPMAYWIVKQEIEHLNLKDYSESAKIMRTALEIEVGNMYRTRCLECDRDNAHVKYFLWVKVKKCNRCGRQIDLFPGYLLAGNARHPKNVYVCPICGELSEADDRKNPGECRHCQSLLLSSGPAKRGSCACPQCGVTNSFPNAESGPLGHRMFAIEYFCLFCKGNHKGRFFKKPDNDDLNRVSEAEARWKKICPKYVPDDDIPAGDETDRLHRWGYRHYHEMFNKRQLLGLELSARLVAKVNNERVRNALSTNLSDLLRYQNMLCRYDTMALKSLDIFSVHGFPVGLIQCESNILGIQRPGSSVCIGSGGWANIIEKFRKAKSYCDDPFEVRHRDGRKEIVHIKGEWIGDHLNEVSSEDRRSVTILCTDAANSSIPADSLDGVFTDPPYFGNVQYAELMDFCYVWLRKLVGGSSPAFAEATTRRAGELTNNVNMGRGLDHFTEGISSVYRKMALALKPGAPLAFTYHHNDIKAYYPIAVAILDAGLTCSASLPCPAEMGASIHISGTGSSIIDTVFVCRSTGSVPKALLTETPTGVAGLVRNDLDNLKAGNVQPTVGDIRCIIYGHLTRLAIWTLKERWDKEDSTAKRIQKVADWLHKFGNWQEVERRLDFEAPKRQSDIKTMFREDSKAYGDKDAEVSF